MWSQSDRAIGNVLPIFWDVSWELRFDRCIVSRRQSFQYLKLLDGKCWSQLLQLPLWSRSDKLIGDIGLLAFETCHLKITSIGAGATNRQAFHYLYCLLITDTVDIQFLNVSFCRSSVSLIGKCCQLCFSVVQWSKGVDRCVSIQTRAFQCMMGNLWPTFLSQTLDC